MNDDAVLLDRWVAGDVEAGQTLVGRHYDHVYRFFFGKVAEEAASDLTQTVFEVLCKRRADFRGDSKIRTFIFGIARWTLHAHFRKRRKEFDPLTHSIQDPAVNSAFSSLYSLKQREVLLVQALRTLPVDDQVLLELAYHEGLSRKQLAEVYELPSGTIASRVRRAKERLLEATKTLVRDPSQRTELEQSLDECLEEIGRRVRAERAANTSA